MKKLGAILFGIVFILGLSIVTAPAQQDETVDPDGVVSSSGFWWPDDPIYEDFNDWYTDPDADFASNIYDDSYLSGGLTVDLEDPTGGPYTAIKVWLRTRSFGDTDVVVRLKGVQDLGGEWKQEMAGGFTEYSSDEVPGLWTGLNMSAAALADLQVEIEIYAVDMLDISAIQVELVSEDTDTIPEVTEPIQVTIDYRPYRSSNSLNYRSRGKVRVVIFGSAAVDVSEIDRESVRLAGVAPVRDRIRRVYSRADRARDEHHDLVLMFKTQQLIKALEESSGEELENGDQVVLELTGNLKLTGILEDDGVTPIEGEDTAVVYGKRHKHKKKGKWKNHWKWWR